MAILKSNGIVTFSSVPTDAPTTNGPTFGRLEDTNTFYYWNGSAWVTKIIGDDTAYDATTWNNNVNVPTKNAIRDKFESLTIPVASDVAYDATTWNNNTDVPTKNAVRDKFEAITGTIPLIYKAIIAQTGTSDPTSTIIYNTLGEVPTFARQSEGVYELGITGTPFTVNKTFVLGTLNNDTSAPILRAGWTANNKITFKTSDETFGANELEGSFQLLIEVYP